MRKIKIDKKLQKQLDKLFRKDRNRYFIIIKKMEDIEESKNPNHYKNLRGHLQKYKEVHINTHFVLVFQYIESTNTIIFCEFCHHKDIFKW